MRVTLRIHWPGYQDWRFENGIDVFDHTHNANPQTLERIVQKVARLVRTFYDEMRVNGSREQDWCLDRINFDDLYLVELRQVSKGSWQPVICWSAA
ncbi:hypothetical protein PsYK624_091140 [Phanerochaete sordida]|uniref:Uncharacterized protein n=1 Tax=Phanerochaete sordida TaxID=48140 RepID=A0A9P3GFU4_9APHY|nr:hypothetical protein PsYK624_091140 [Phanerochaete sordida]